MSRSTDFRGEGKTSGSNLFKALGLLFAVIGLGVIAGQFMSGQSISNWGSWLGAFIAGIGLAASAYAIILQTKYGEATSWSLALSRLGSLHDHALSDESLARILSEPIDEDGLIYIDPADLALTPKQRIWIGSLFSAYEQIYIATMALQKESKRVWRIYIKNQLNKPTLRAVFIADAENAKDYHEEFWAFVRGKRNGVDVGFSAIAPHFFQKNDNKTPSEVLRFEGYRARPLGDSDIKSWLEIYRDPAVRKQMYAAPTETEDELAKYLKRGSFYSLLNSCGEVVGGFNFYEEHGTRASFGIVIHPKFRNQGLGHILVRYMKDEALRLGIKTLRADVYSDNASCLSLMNKTGFRRFIWVEANI